MTDFSSELFVASLAIIGVTVIISALLSGLIERGGGSVSSHTNSSGDARLNLRVLAALSEAELQSKLKLARVKGCRWLAECRQRTAT